MQDSAVYFKAAFCDVVSGNTADLSPLPSNARRERRANGPRDGRRRQSQFYTDLQADDIILTWR